MMQAEHENLIEAAADFLAAVRMRRGETLDSYEARISAQFQDCEAR